MRLQVGSFELNTFALFSIEGPGIGEICIGRDEPTHPYEKRVRLFNRWWLWRTSPRDIQRMRQEYLDRKN